MLICLHISRIIMAVIVRFVVMSTVNHCLVLVLAPLGNGIECTE
jgi:hypothetical protein